MQTVTIEAMNAARSDPCSASSTARPTTKQMTEVSNGREGLPRVGFRSVPVSPLAPIRRARRVIVTRMSRNGTPSTNPCCGSQVHTVSSLINSDCTMPRPRPAAAVSQNERNPPINTAPRAGTTKSV